MRFRGPVLLLLLAGIVVHGAAAVAVVARTGRLDTYAFESLDCGEYYNIARNLIDHGAFSASVAAPLSPDTWRTPGYPMFLAAAMLAVGKSPAALLVVQQVIAVLSVVLFFRVAERNLRTRRALVAAMLFMVEPYGLYYSFWLLSTTWFTFLLLVTWWCYESAARSRTWPMLAATGCCSGFLVLIWPGAILVPVGLAITLLVQGPTASYRPDAPSENPGPGSELVGIAIHRTTRRFRAAAIFAVCCIVVVASWMTRNRMVAEHFALSHQSGIVLAYFKATEVELWRQGRTADRYAETSLNPENKERPHPVWEGIDETLRDRMKSRTGQDASALNWSNLAQGNKTSLDSFEISSELTAIAGQMMSRSWRASVLCLAERIGENLVFPLGLAISPPSGVDPNRLKSVVIGAVYLALALAALAGFIRAMGAWSAVSFPLLSFVALAITTTPQIDPRFRVPMVPLLLFMAFIGKK